MNTLPAPRDDTCLVSTLHIITPADPVPYYLHPVWLEQVSSRVGRTIDYTAAALTMASNNPYVRLGGTLLSHLS